MRRRVLSSAVVCSAVAFAFAAGAVWGDVTVTPLGDDGAMVQAGGPVPTMQDAQSDLDSGKHAMCLQKIARILNSTPAPSPSDRCALLSLKGECLLQQQQALLAAESFNAASEAATEKPDIARATTICELIKRSVNFLYTPTSGKERKPLSILDKAERQPLLVALFADEYARAKLSADTVMQQPDIQPILNFAPTVRRLALYELGATDAQPQSTALQQNLGGHAQDLIKSAIDTMNSNADTLSQEAQQTTQVPAAYNQAAHTQRRGLSDQDKAQVNDMLAGTDKIASLVKELVPALSLDTDFFKDQLTANDALAKRLRAMLVGIYRVIGNSQQQGGNGNNNGGRGGHGGGGGGRGGGGGGWGG